MRHIIDRIDEYLPFGAQEGYLTAAYIASQKPSRQCSCRIEPHRNLHCMPGSGQSKGSSLHLKTFSSMHQLTPSLCLTEHESEREAETGRIKRRMVEEKGVKKKNTQKALTRAPCGVVTQRASCLWGHRMEPPSHTSQPITALECATSQLEWNGYARPGSRQSRQRPSSQM